MKIITMKRASKILGTNTSMRGKDFAKEYRLTLLDTDAQHGKGKAIFFDEAEVIKRANERREKGLAESISKIDQPYELLRLMVADIELIKTRQHALIMQIRHQASDLGIDLVPEIEAIP
jgi:predicted methyltransferase